jgi:hypothetical protein
MSTQTNQQLVLNLLETGKIDINEADWLLERFYDQPIRQPATPYPPENNKIILEIDADQENLQAVIKILNQALCIGSDTEHKTSFLQRFTRRITPKAAAH